MNPHEMKPIAAFQSNLSYSGNIPGYFCVGELATGVLSIESASSSKQTQRRLHSRRDESSLSVTTYVLDQVGVTYRLTKANQSSLGLRDMRTSILTHVFKEGFHIYSLRVRFAVRMYLVRPPGVNKRMIGVDCQIRPTLLRLFLHQPAFKMTQRRFESGSNGGLLTQVFS